MNDTTTTFPEFSHPNAHLYSDEIHFRLCGVPLSRLYRMRDDARRKGKAHADRANRLTMGRQNWKGQDDGQLEVYRANEARLWASTLTVAIAHREWFNASCIAAGGKVVTP